MNTIVPILSKIDMKNSFEVLYSNCNSAKNKDKIQRKEKKKKKKKKQKII